MRKVFKNNSSNNASEHLLIFISFIKWRFKNYFIEVYIWRKNIDYIMMSNQCGYFPCGCLRNLRMSLWWDVSLSDEMTPSLMRCLPLWWDVSLSDEMSPWLDVSLMADNMGKMAAAESLQYGFCERSSLSVNQMALKNVYRLKPPGRFIWGIWLSFIISQFAETSTEGIEGRSERVHSVWGLIRKGNPSLWTRGWICFHLSLSHCLSLWDKVAGLFWWQVNVCVCP